MKRENLYRSILSLLLVFCLAMSGAAAVWAEEDAAEEETEYIPEEYYDPIQTNELAGWPQGDAVPAGAAVVMDLDTGAFLYSKNATQTRYPASITKIMTALVTLEHASLEDRITFSEIVYNIESDSSHAGIQPGETMTIEQALNALMLESANDVANGLAEYVAGSISGFSDLMNEKAAQLGCVNTHFANPHGLHQEDHYTCAYDMALIAQAAYENTEFRRLASTCTFNCPKTNKTPDERYFYNHHKMLQSDSGYYQDWCTGGKTGFTSDAWNTLVTYGEKNGLRLVCVILHDNGADQAYNDTANLMNYGFEQFDRVTVQPQRRFPTFYEAMGLVYLGSVQEGLEISELLQPTASMSGDGMVTLPNGMSAAEVRIKAEKQGSSGSKISYTYHDWTVGSVQMTMAPLVSGLQAPFARKMNLQLLSERSHAVSTRGKEVEATAALVLGRTQDIVTGVLDYTEHFVRENRLVVICIGAVILAVLLIFVLILIMRCSREARRRRHRRQEEKVRLRIEEEIDQKTTDEIEQELRAAMEKERQRQLREANKNKGEVKV